MLTALQTASPAEAAIAAGGVLPAGPVGPVGPQGIQGPQGNPGPVGPSGTPGIQGLPAWGNEAPWAASTVYSANAPASLVYFNGATYVCVVSHTSTGSFDASKWQVVVQVTSPLILNTGAGRTLIIGQNATTGTYNSITLNGTLVNNAMVGITGGATGDNALYIEAPDAIWFQTGGAVNNAVFDSSGRLTIGATSSQLVGGVRSVLQTNRLVGAGWDFTSNTWNGSAGGWAQASGRGGSIGVHGLSNSGDAILYIEADGDTGSAFIASAFAQVTLEGTVSATSMPSRWTFATTPNGTLTPTERLRIDSSGNITGSGTGNLGPAISSTVHFSLTGGANLGGSFLGGAYAFIDATSTSATGSGYYMGTHAYGGTGGGGWGERYYGFFARNVRGSEQAVGSGDLLGGVAFRGYDGAVYRFAGKIDFLVDGAVSSGVVPSRITFAVNASNTEAMRIDSNGNIVTGGVAAQTGLNATVAPFQMNGLGSTIFEVQRWDAGGNPAAVWLAKSRSGTIGTQAAVIVNDTLGNVSAGGSDGTAFRFVTSNDHSYDIFGQINATASGSFTTASTSITLTGPGGGYIIPGAVVWDTTANAKVGTVLTQNGSTLVLTAASLINSSGSSDSLQFITPNTIPGRQTFSTSQVQVIDMNATASFTTSSTTISLAGTLPSWAINGSYVYDRTTNSAIGKVSSGAGTSTITLQAASLINSSGSSDNIQIQAPAAVMTEVMRLDSSGMVTIQPSSFWWSFAQLYIASNNNSPWNIQVDQFAGAITDPCYVLFRKSRGLYGGANVAVASGDGLLQLMCRGADATATPVFQNSAAIFADVDAAPTAGSVPGRWRFSTMPSGGSLTERLRIDSTGHVVIGGVAAQVMNTITPYLQLQGVNQDTSTYATARWNAGAGGPNFIFFKSRGASIGTNAAVSSASGGDQLGVIAFDGDGGAGFLDACYIIGTVDGTVTTGSVPGRLGLYTGVGGAPAERLRIDSSGNVNIGNNGATIASIFSANPRFQVSNTAATNTQALDARLYSNDTNAPFISFVKSRGAAIGTNTVVQNGDGLGYIDAGGYDATGTPVLQESAYIAFDCDAAPSAGAVPGRIRFNTASSGGSRIEVMRLDSNQQIDLRQVPNANRATITGNNQAGVSVANGANTAICPGFRGFIYITNETGSGTGNGDSALYLLTTSGGNVLVAQCGSGSWVAPTTTPAAGKSSVSGGAPWNVYNNVGNTATFKIMAFRLN